MEPRQTKSKKAPELQKELPKPKLQIVKLEERIAPGFNMQHNETLVREPAKATPKAAEGRRKEPKLQIIKLEGRITPGINMQHNETLVRESARTTPKAAEAPQVVADAPHAHGRRDRGDSRTRDPRAPTSA